MNRPRQFALSTVVASLYALLPAPLLAQVVDRLDTRSDGQDARNDALLATPNLATPEPSLRRLWCKRWRSSQLELAVFG